MIWSAFLIGLVGSLHCVGMCGPLVITFTSKAGRAAYISFALYHFSRILIYMFVGALFGLLGTAFNLLDYQRIGAIAIGSLIIVFYAVPGWRNRLEGAYYNTRFYQSIKAKFTGYYGTRLRWVAAGIVNGFLPCGLIYLAAAGAILSGSMINSMVFMAIFGLGTLPALLILSMLNQRIPQIFKRLPNAITFLAIFSGGIMIIRGIVISDPDWNQLLTQQINHLVSVCGF